MACCHTAAHSKDISDAAREVGLDIATHLGNGMRGIHHRDVGALGSLLLLDNIFYEVDSPHPVAQVCGDEMCIRDRTRLWRPSRPQRRT